MHRLSIDQLRQDIRESLDSFVGQPITPAMREEMKYKERQIVEAHKERYYADFADHRREKDLLERIKQKERAKRYTAMPNDTKADELLSKNDDI